MEIGMAIVAFILAAVIWKRVGMPLETDLNHGNRIEELAGTEIHKDALAIVQLVRAGYSPIPRLNAILAKHDVYHVVQVCAIARKIDPRIKVHLHHRVTGDVLTPEVWSEQHPRPDR